jgi:hypothetical protein
MNQLHTISPSARLKPPQRNTQDHMNTRTPANGCVMWSVVILSAVLVADARADDSEIRALKQQVQELKDSVQQLRDRINVLENREQGASWVPATVASTPPAISAEPTTAPSPSKTQASPPLSATASAQTMAVDDKVVLLRNSWRHISTGMKQEEVKETLGPPTKEMLMNGKLVWYYHYSGLGAGSVFFNANGRSSSSQPPNLGWGY